MADRTARVTKIVCPACEGTGIFDLLDTACMWCGGKKRLPTKEALRYADTIYCLSGGGYIDGDMSLAELRAEEKRAENIYALAGMKAPWKEPSDG